MVKGTLVRQQNAERISRGNECALPCITCQNAKKGVHMHWRSNCPGSKRSK